MKDEKAKYLLVDAKEIHKQLYNVKREFAFNDGYNVYIPDRIIDAKEIFSKYNIPEEFQKIIIKINIPFFIKYEAEEYTMGFPFDITAGKIQKENNSKYISVSNYPILYDSQMFRSKINFKTQLNYLGFNEVIDFLIQMGDNSYLKPYLKSIKDFFDITLDIDYLYEVWNQEKNVKKSLKLYKKKYPHK